MKPCCINAHETNKTLEATFRFIYENQNLPNGEYYETLIFLGIALTKSNSYENYTNRSEAFNLIIGKILEVKENYCKLETISTCENEVQVYTVAYSDIDNVISSVLLNFSDKYIKYMSLLPSICVCPGNRYYDLLARFEETLLTIKETELIYFIYAGIFSRGYSKDKFKIIRNLIYVNKDSILPITSAGGFFIAEEDPLKEESLGEKPLDLETLKDKKITVDSSRGCF